MPAYAAWLEEMLAAAEPPQRSGRRTASALPASINPQRVILVADYIPSPAKLVRLLGGLPTMIVAPMKPAEPIPGVEYTTFRTATNPLEWGPEADRAVANGADTVAFLLPPDELHGRTLLRLWRAGVTQCLLLSRDRVEIVHPLVEAARKKFKGVLRKWASAARSPCAGGRMTVEDCKRFLEAIDQVRPLRQGLPTRPLRIAHFICSLNTGGAERQVCNAAIAQKQAGHQVRVLLRLAPVGHDGYYLRLLEPHGIPARLAGVAWQPGFLDNWAKRGISPRTMTMLPAEFRRMVMDMAGELLAEPVDVLHCYVDDCNIVGLVAGLIAQTPAIVLSVRNGNPTNFPGLLRPWMKPWYEAVRGIDGIGLSSNSEAGARDYERWLNFAAGSIGVIRNAFVPPPLPTSEEVARIRQEFGLADGIPVIAGVFRLHPEKRPLLFVRLIARLHRQLPNLRVLLAGVGVMEAAVRQEIAQLRLQNVVHLLGQRKDLPAILAASDVMLLVSDWEGTPNAVIESQYVGCVPVVTDAGGTAEAIVPGATALLLEQNDFEGIVHGVLELLRNPNRRAAMARAGRSMITDRFNAQRAHEETLALYMRLLTAGRNAAASGLRPAA